MTKEEKYYMYIVDRYDGDSEIDNMIKAHELCRALEGKLEKKGIKAAVATEYLLSYSESLIKEAGNDKAYSFYKNMLKEREEVHITYDQLVEMVNE